MKRSTFYMKSITASVARRKSRIAIALLAIVVGAAILSGLVTIYIDIPRQMGMQMRSYGANLILMPSEGADDMTTDQINKAVSVIPDDDVVGITPYRYENMTINDTPVVVAGIDLPSVQSTSPYWYVTGEWPDAPGEILVGLDQASTYDLHVGDTVTLEYAPKADPNSPKASNDQITKDFTVSGLLDTGGNEEGYFFISKEDMGDIIGAENMTYTLAELSVRADSNELEQYTEEISDMDEGVTPQLVKRVAESEATVLTKLQALVLLVTIVVLALTMICVATTMTAVVTERRQEIGLRKALGASDKSITQEFMGEGLLLGAVGGLIGAFLGFGFAQLISTTVFNSSITIMPLLVPVTIVVSLAVTALACILPVRNATKVDPALVLKGE